MVILIQQIVYPNFKYVVNFLNVCARVLNNTKQCGYVTGECECSVGWTGTDCPEDVDECKSAFTSSMNLFFKSV